MVEYRPRVVDSELAERMASSGAVVIEGPKACGKTATAERVAKTVFRLDVDAGARALVDTAPEVLLDAPPPVLFDEWQVAPKVWNLVRRAVDDRGTRGHYILTGSATPNDEATHHTGAGRYSWLRMRPMSLFELGVSSGAVSIRGLFDGDFDAALDPGVDVPTLIDHIVIGGWPTLLNATPSEARRSHRSYLNTIINADLPSLGLRRAPTALRRVLTSLGRATGTELTIQSIATDVGGADGPARRETISGYLDALSRLMLTEDVPAWGPHMRSTTPLRKSPTRYLTDPSLGVAAIGAGPTQLLRDLNATGFHFEALVVRDLRVYTQPLDGHLWHWRDNNGHEVDVIVTLDDGRWGAFEVKMNPDAADAAADSLLRFAAKVDTTKIGDPAFLGVITTKSPAHRRSDGVYVLPIGALGP